MADPVKLHPDWPEVNLSEPDAYGSYWDHPVPVCDLGTALSEEYSCQEYALPLAGPVERPVRLHDLAQVVRYYVEHNGDVWTPGNLDGGTDLLLVVVARTTDNRWIAVEAWTDYTGWGCQDSSDVRIGDSEQAVVRYGLTNDARSRLGYPLIEEAGRG